jgi:hypothetical protein
MIHLVIFTIVLALTVVIQAATPPEFPKLTADILVSLTGAALSILAYIIPPFRRFQAKLGEWTPAFMAGALLLVATGYQAVWCQYNTTCVVANWQGIVLVWGTAFAANSGIYSAFIKKPKAEEKAKLSAGNEDTRLSE